MFNFQGFEVSEEDLQAAAELSGVLDAPDDYLSPELHTHFNSIVPEPEKIQSNEFVQKYLLLKEQFQSLSM